ncbi:hypothetical protein GW17_00029587 [Ensete ventricosum]|nr:hypothetical protein GW17_00029587 [Ensete ventricosum]
MGSGPWYPLLWVRWYVSGSESKKTKESFAETSGGEGEEDTWRCFGVRDHGIRRGRRFEPAACRGSELNAESTEPPRSSRSLR